MRPTNPRTCCRWEAIFGQCFHPHLFVIDFGAWSIRGGGELDVLVQRPFWARARDLRFWHVVSVDVQALGDRDLKAGRSPWGCSERKTPLVEKNFPFRSQNRSRHVASSPLPRIAISPRNSSVGSLPNHLITMGEIWLLTSKIFFDWRNNPSKRA